MSIKTHTQELLFATTPSLIIPDTGTQYKSIIKEEMDVHAMKFYHKLRDNQQLI